MNKKKTSYIALMLILTLMSGCGLKTVDETQNATTTVINEETTVSMKETEQVTETENITHDEMLVEETEIVENEISNSEPADVETTENNNLIEESAAEASEIENVSHSNDAEKSTEPITVEKQEFVVSFVEVDEFVYATTGLNVRTGPGTEYERIGQLSYNEKIQRIGIGDNNWSKIIYNGSEAYVSSNYLSKEELSSKINLSNYSKVNSYSGLSSTDIQVVNGLFAEYSKYKNGEVDKVVVTVDEQLDYSSYTRVVSFFAIYFSNYDDLDTVVDYVISGQTTNVSLNLDNFCKYQEERSTLNAKINNILSGFSEGSEKEKLQQIVNYLVRNTYYVETKLNAKDVLFSGVGNCNGYSMAFQAMATRLGIQCDICVGYSNSGRHAWNRVRLSNGEVLYYDLVYYESGGNQKYIANSTSPWNNFVINNYY